MIFRKSQQLFLVNRQILLNLRHLFSRNKTSNLLVITGHLLENNSPEPSQPKLGWWPVDS